MGRGVWLGNAPKPSPPEPPACRRPTPGSVKALGCRRMGQDGDAKAPQRGLQHPGLERVGMVHAEGVTRMVTM